jgi:CHASE2 domain-containing sensor protein
LLAAFAAGESLPYAVRQARELLQGVEGEFPCASWLPVMVQNPAGASLTWRSGIQPKALPKAKPARWWRWILATSLGITGCVMGGRHFGLLQSWELSAFDQLMQLRPPEKPDPRLLIVTVTEDDVRSQTPDPDPRRGSLSDGSLAKLMQILASHQPAAIGLDIYRDYPVSQKFAALNQQMKTDDRLVGVCKVSEEGGDPGVGPAPELGSDRAGFSDVLLDPDQIVRRHYLALTPPPASPCAASYGISTQLALRYLATQGVNLEFADSGAWKLGKVELLPLEAHTGGYQKLDPRGHQILLNYRATPSLLDIAPRITLGQVLAGKLSAEAVKDRIVLIGTTADSFHDRALTPYRTDRGSIQPIPGVVLQAQMTSQLISAVLDGRNLLRTWPLGIEVLWVWSWAAVGAAVGAFVRRPVQGAGGTAGAIAILSAACLVLLQFGWWVPFIPALMAGLGSGCAVAITRSRNPKL